MIPGLNLLHAALSVISSQPVTYYADDGRATTATGRQVTAYADGVTVAQGSVQAVPRARYEALGLDWTKSHVVWFVEQSVLGVQRDISGDQFSYAGTRYGVVSVTRWLAQDGWVEVLGVEVQPDA